MASNPILMNAVAGYQGDVVQTPEARAKEAKSSDVHWLTPRMFRLWVDVGLRGYTAQGLPSPGWRGRLEARNVAFATAPSVACRVYRTPHGLAGAPETGQLRQALRAAADTGGGV
ncbi:hypothetical protein [Streptomyces coelicoflavus]|uniref:hypothetical protein n=1 Tax=Streptomyces coelicoflavus TaxID=285562 RepID=UPI0036C91613